MASQNTRRNREPTRTLPERVEQVFYAHGLFCSSHPVLVISFAIAVVLLCCYPLLNLPLPGNVPQQLLGNLSLQGYNGSSRDASEVQAPRWYSSQPLVYVQQVVIKTAVSPWTEDLVLTDAFRAPLAEVFKLLEVVQNYQLENSSKTLSHLCLHVEAVKMKSDKKLLPEYNCLVLSPANLWQQNRQHFQEDPNLLSTIFNYQNLQKGKSSLTEMLFGMNMKDTGIKRYPLRTRQRVLQFAITVILKDYDVQFLNGLRQRLISLYPLHQPTDNIMDGAAADVLEVLHVYYPGEFNLYELVPFTFTCVMSFLYIYFSVRKIELIKSKVGMAFSAVVTVLACFCMTIGLCFFFGLVLTFNGKEVFPYLVVLVGIENVLVLTKSVVSTPAHLDVKIRIAQGLSREGWCITQNLLIEVTILTVGLFTFVPTIQEFCIFSIVGLLSDFFLQMFFFTTVLAIDIHRMELSSDSQSRRIHHNHANSSNPPLNRTQHRQFRSPTLGNSGRLLTRSKSHPRLNGITSLNYPTNVIAPHNTPPPLDKLPKRLRLVHFWARTRIFQRGFMICMIVWIGIIAYNSGVMQQMFQVYPELQNDSQKIAPDIGSRSTLDETEDLKDYYTATKSRESHVLSDADRAAILDNIDDLQTLHSLIDVEESGVSVRTSKIFKQLKAEAEDQARSTNSSQDDLARLKHTGFDPWRRLSHHHWPAILSLYNMSVAGQYISILPAIRISHIVTPETARALRNLEERATQHFQWQTLAAALDPLDFSDGESDKDLSLRSLSRSYLGSDVPFIPSSPMEIFLTAVLCIISVVVLAYMMVVLYRCVCTRNYAEWRASWSGECEQVADSISQVVMEAVPLILDSHQQEVECMATDGSVVVSSCLGGQLRVWDSLSGELLSSIDRKMYFSTLQKMASGNMYGGEVDSEDLPLSDYESGSPPSRGEAAGEDSSVCSAARKIESYQWELPDLRSFINTNFTSRSAPSKTNVGLPFSEPSSLAHVNRNGFDFGSRYQELFRNYRNYSDLFADDDSDVELQKNSTPDSFSSSTECGQSPTGTTSALLIPKAGKSEFSGYFPMRCANSVDSNSVLSLRKKAKCKLGDIMDVDFDIQNIDEVSSKEDLIHRFNKSYLTKFNNSSQAHFNDSDGSGLSKNCDLHCVNVNDNFTCNDSSTQNFSSDKFSQVSRHQEKPVSTPLSAKNSQKLPFSVGIDNFDGDCRSHSLSGPSATSINEKRRSTINNPNVPPIWCLDCHENLVVLGCANGRLEFWEGSVGKFKCLFEDGSGIGVTAVKIIGNRVVAAKLSGAVDFLELESYSSQGRPLDWGFTSYRRTHVRTGSAGSISDWDKRASQDSLEEDIRCIRLNTTKAHQQPITVLDSEGGRVLTGSQDHTLKVFRLEDHLPLYTLHGHSGPISCLFIDRISPMMSGSGSQDGLLCVWDLLTGACMYSIQAHDGSIVALTYSASYVISLGTDERLCVWERFQGHLLNTIQVAHTYCSSMVMLTHNLLITSKQGSLVVWDVRTGDPVRIVKLGHRDRCVFVKQILLLRDSVACDYSNQLRIVRFPLVTDKCD